jgi:molybdopterin converting factor small subunit
MSITVELTYDLAKALGQRRLEFSTAFTLDDILRQTREQFGSHTDAYDNLTRVTALAINGVLVKHRPGRATLLVDGDRVSFVKAAAGG